MEEVLARLELVSDIMAEGCMVVRNTGDQVWREERHIIDFIVPMGYKHPKPPNQNHLLSKSNLIDTLIAAVPWNRKEMLYV